MLRVVATQGGENLTIGDAHAQTEPLTDCGESVASGARQGCAVAGETTEGAAELGVGAALRRAPNRHDAVADKVVNDATVERCQPRDAGE
jgi:hypothetical protein